MKRVFEWIKRSRLVFWIAILIRWLKGKANPIFAGGVHFITGASGSGKTLLSNYIIQTITQRSGGFFWANMDQYDHKITKVFDLETLFKDGKQIRKLNKSIKYNNAISYSRGIIYDELNAIFNRRINREKKYNDLFVPLITSVVTHRHQGHPRILLIGQMQQDIQFHQVVKYKHEVECTKNYSYHYWKKDLNLVKIPFILHVASSMRTGTDKDGNPIYKEIGRQKIPVTMALLESYDTYAFERLFDDLPSYEPDKSP